MGAGEQVVQRVLAGLEDRKIFKVDSARPKTVIFTNLCVPDDRDPRHTPGG